MAISGRNAERMQSSLPSMKLEILNDKKEIHSYLRKDAEIQYYCLGDLDEFFFPRTKWFAITENSLILSLGLLYNGGDVPTFLLFYKNSPEPSLNLLKFTREQLPDLFYTHLTPPLKSFFGREEIKEDYGIHYKMVLKKQALPAGNDSGIRRLTISDLDEIQAFYSVAYPHNWFDKRMLETGKYFGYSFGGKLSGVAGIHVYSPETRVAALGNIAVHPGYRGRGIAFNLTVKLCHDLLREVDIIGLNVKADNTHAIRSYMKAGFEITGEYDECLIQKLIGA